MGMLFVELRLLLMLLKEDEKLFIGAAAALAETVLTSIVFGVRTWTKFDDYVLLLRHIPSGEYCRCTDILGWS